MPRLPSDTVLMVVDVQLAADHPKWGPRNNPGAEKKIAELLAAWRSAKMPVVHIRHDSVTPGSPYTPNTPGHPFKPEVMPLPDETVIGKNANSAFIGTDLEDKLGAMGTTTMVVCGVSTPHCVESTVRHAGNLGYRVFVPTDACWCTDVRDLAGKLWPAEDVHQLSMAVLNGEFASVTTSDALIAASKMPHPSSWKTAGN
jgi:nicotinamidase-related amidase